MEGGWVGQGSFPHVWSWNSVNTVSGRGMSDDVLGHLRGVRKYSDARCITMEGAWPLITLAGVSPEVPYMGRWQSTSLPRTTSQA